jgi:hypothetical protein
MELVDPGNMASLPARRRKNSTPFYSVFNFQFATSSRRSLSTMVHPSLLLAESNGHDDVITTNDASQATSSPFSHQALPTHPDSKSSHYPPMCTPERSNMTPSPTSPPLPHGLRACFPLHRCITPSPPPRRKRPRGVHLSKSGGGNENEEAEGGRVKESTTFFTPSHVRLEYSLGQRLI